MLLRPGGDQLERQTDYMFFLERYNKRPATFTKWKLSLLPTFLASSRGPFSPACPASGPESRHYPELKQTRFHQNHNFREVLPIQLAGTASSVIVVSLIDR